MDGSSLRNDSLHGQAERALARICGRGDRARRAALRAGLFHPCTWAAFVALGQAGQAGALAALEFCQDQDEASDAVQAAALLMLDPVRQAAAAKDARGKGLAWDLAAPETHARCARSRARRDHKARAGGAEAPADLPDNDAEGRSPRARWEPPSLDEVTGAPLLLLLRAEAEASEDELGAGLKLGAIAPPRTRGRPTKSEVLERAGQIKLPGLPPGGSTTRSSSATSRRCPPPPAPAQLDLWGRP